MKLIKQVDECLGITSEPEQIYVNRPSRQRRSFKFNKGYWDSQRLTGILNIYDNDFGYIALVVQDSLVKDYIDPTDKGQYQYWVETFKIQGYNLVYGLKVQTGLWQNNTALIDGVLVEIKSCGDGNVIVKVCDTWLQIDHSYIEVPANLSLTGA